MAQQFIKIFDDTVLKQSINQGYETQRTNTRLGKFTMGELAFTRDTARVFAGNFTNLEFKEDSEAVTGGSLVGNKYLGIIDSKPLTHFLINSQDGKSQTSMYLPLNYEKDTTYSSQIEDENGIKKKFTEKALLRSDSKFRRDAKNSGWSKGATYNDEYDAYNGDYIFDVYNNALILFDTNIKPVKSTAEPNWTINETTHEQKFYIDGDSALGTYTEAGDKTNYSTARTRLTNVEKLTTDTTDYTVLGNELYPIYGDGYVIMRIIEPDGITLGYKERSFNQATGIPNDGNYSHNYIELKSIPLDKLQPLFDPKYFTVTSDGKSGRHFTFTGEMGAISSSNIISPSGVLTLSPKLKFSEGATINFDLSKTKDTAAKYMCLKQLSEGNYQASIQDPCSLTLKMGEKEYSTSITPGGNAVLNLDTGSGDNVEPGRMIHDPFFTSMGDVSEDSSGGNVFYSGNSMYDSSGSLISTEEIPGISFNDDGSFPIEITQPHSYFVLYDSSGANSTYEIYDSTNEDGTTEIDFRGSLEHPYVSSGFNLLKEPTIIGWGANSSVIKSSYAKYFINPYVISPKCNNCEASGMGVVGHVNPNINISDNWTTDIFDNSDLLKTLTESTETGAHIPDHASSIVCEIIIQKVTTTNTETGTQVTPEPKCMVVAGDLVDLKANIAKLNFDSDSYSGISLSSFPTVTTYGSAWNKIKHICQYSGESRMTFDLPLYRDKNVMKYFTVGIVSQNCNFVIRAIGYRA